MAAVRRRCCGGVVVARRRRSGLRVSNTPGHCGRVSRHQLPRGGTGRGGTGRGGPGRGGAGQEWGWQPGHADWRAPGGWRRNQVR